MHRTADSVRPRHQTFAAAAYHLNHQNVIPRTTGAAVVGDNHNSTNEGGGGRLYKRPKSTRQQRIIQRIIFIIIVVPLILFLFLTLVGLISMRSHSSSSLSSLSSSSSSFIRNGGAASDPMQSFLSPSRFAQQQQQQQQHQAKNDQGERRKKEGTQQASSSTPVVVVVGMFQGLPVTYHHHEANNTGIASSVHCVGENFRTDDTAWMVRSCQFRNLCFDMNRKDFVIFQSAQEERLQQRLEKLQQKRIQKQCQQQQQDGTTNSGICQSALDTTQNLVSISSLALQNHTTVSLGSLNINPKWTNSANDIGRLKWFPKIIPHSSMLPPLGQGYYQLPDDVVWVPFHESSSSIMMMNSGNLVWNDLLSIYTLLSMFDLTGSNSYNNSNDDKRRRRLLLMRRVLDEHPPLLAATSCDLNATSLEHCRLLLKKFLPVMGIHPPLQFNTNLDYEFTLFQHQQQKQEQKSHLICARYGAAGIGMLSSSAAAAHHHDSGKTREEASLSQSDYYKDTFNMGRGATLRAFGNFMASNLGIRNNNNNNNSDPPGASNSASAIQQGSFSVPYKITISMDSSTRHYSRDMDHSKQMMALIQKEFASRGGSGGDGVVDSNDVVIQSFDVQELTLVEQARIAAESAIFVSVCGGGSFMATFLSPGASLIIYDDDDDEQEQEGGHHEQDAHQQQQQPARIDWDLLSNAGYFRAHWLPLQRNHAALVDLMRRELDRIRTL